MRRNSFVAAVGMTVALLASGPTQAEAPVDRRVIGAATLENIPAIPPEVIAAVQRYQSSRPASFGDWMADGSMLISTRFGTTAQIHRIAQPMGARTQLTFFGEPVGGVAAASGSDRFVFTKDTGGDEWFQIFVQGASGEAISLTEPGTQNSSPVITRDGKRVFWARAIKGSGGRVIQSAILGDPASRRNIYEEPAGGIAVADVSDDGSSLLLARQISNRVTQLRLLDLVTGRTREITPGPAARYERATFARSGRSVLAISDRESDVRRIVEIDLATGRIVPITPAQSWDVEDFDVSKDGGRLAWIINEDGYSRLHVRDLASGNDVSINDAPRGVIGNLKFSPDGRQLGFNVSSATAPGDVYSLELEGGRLTRWSASERGPINPQRLIEPQLIRFTSFDGLSVPAFVYRPVNTPVGVKTPVLISIHGGPEGQSRPGWSSSLQYYADQLGATVVVPNVRGSDGYGTRYLSLDDGPKREDSVKDIGALLDWVATRPELDARRIAVIGGSYGGYMVLASMTHYSDRLVGGVNLFGISNWISFLQNTEAYRRDNRRAEYGDERQPGMRAVFERISPLANVHQITKPMLVQQGANDPRVPKSESDQVVAALRARGVPASYLVFADEGHGWRKRPNQELSLAVETMFLRGILKADGPADRQ